MVTHLVTLGPNNRPTKPPRRKKEVEFGFSLFFRYWEATFFRFTSEVRLSSLFLLLTNYKKQNRRRSANRRAPNMGGSDGILGNRDVERSKATLSTASSKWLKRRERWLVGLGVILHAVYMMSIFDIYFKTPIVHGMDPVTPRFKAPAKRLVLLVGTSYVESRSTCLWNCLREILLQF